MKIQNITSIQSNAFGQDGALNCVMTTFPSMTALVKSTCTYLPCPPLNGCPLTIGTYGSMYICAFVCVHHDRVNNFVLTIAVPTMSPSVELTMIPTGIVRLPTVCT